MCRTIDLKPPHLPVGTLLRLGSGEWSHCATLGTYLEMTLAGIHRNAVHEDETGLWVWQVGHEHPACQWDHIDPHPPRLQVMARVDAPPVGGRRMAADL
ncbi:hypothetical protein ACN28C_04070 [Plantactinospora sp. WMMC1484]|uniref:hypothetical protein n=1 Tax=Plantactinospora sp. WMMC1484 TaxID=3404122 RepID=UPI003BF50525